MSIVVPVRCIICTLHCNDKLIYAERKQIKYHIYHDHDYEEKLRTARAIVLIETDEKRSAEWLSIHLAELSIISSPHPSKGES